MTTTAARVRLAPRERQIIEDLAEGHALTVVAQSLAIREGTASGYLRHAKRKLYGVSENAAVVAVAYATEVITQPALLEPNALTLPREQRDLVPLIAKGMVAAQMARMLKRPLDIVRRDGRDLMATLEARNRAHTIKRAWQYQVLTADQVTSWLR